MKKLLLLPLALLALVVPAAHAATLFDITNTNARNNYTGTIGASFTVKSLAEGGSDLLVTSLGFQDYDDNGLTQNHNVGIWDSSNNLLGSVIVLSAGTSNLTVVNHFQYTALTNAITLTAGQTYYIGALVTNGGDAWSDGGQANISNLSSYVKDFNSTVTTTNFARPTIDSGTTDLRWSPANMQFTAVPEPSAALLGGLGVLALLRRRR